MTSDLVKHREMENAAAGTSGSVLFRRLVQDIRIKETLRQNNSGKSTTQKPRMPAFDAQGLIGAIDGQNLEQEGYQRCIGAAVALLKYAHDMIESAEATIAEQNARLAQLEHLSTTDELTGIKNRRGFFDVFMSELDRCARGLSAGGLLILIDLDNFKSINDTYGHMAGDACLRLVARTLQNETRIMDAAARLGGDEFVLLLSSTTRTQAAGRAQDLARKLGRLSLAWYGDEIPVRASIGLKEYKAGDAPEQIFNAADTALYSRKRQRKDESAGEGKTPPA